MIYNFVLEQGFAVINLDFSPIKGPQGNIEYLIFIEKSESKMLRTAVENAVKSAGGDEKDIDIIFSGDLINQLRGKELGERVFISQNMLRRQEQDFLDDVTLEQASEALGTGYVLNLPSGDVTLNKGDYEISSEDMPGWLVATEGAMTIALDITITEALKQEGVARELINRIQNLRKESGFEITDRICVTIEHNELTDGALENFKEYICAQVLADSLDVVDEIKGDYKVLDFEDFQGKIVIVKNN